MYYYKVKYSDKELDLLIKNPNFNKLFLESIRNIEEQRMEYLRNKYPVQHRKKSLFSKIFHKGIK